MTLRQNGIDVVKKTLTSLRDNSFTLSLKVSLKSVGNFLSYKAEKESEKKRKSIIIIKRNRRITRGSSVENGRP